MKKELRKCFTCFSFINAWKRMTGDKEYQPDVGAWCRTSSSSKLHWGHVYKVRPKYRLVRTLCGESIVIRKEKKKDGKQG